jgi:hypothetical protein
MGLALGIETEWERHQQRPARRTAREFCQETGEKGSQEETTSTERPRLSIPNPAVAHREKGLAFLTVLWENVGRRRAWRWDRSCGLSIGGREMRDKARWAIVCVAVITGGCAVTPTPEEIAKADYGPFPENYKQIITDYYYKTLIDPFSAQYEWTDGPTKGWQVPDTGELIMNKCYYGYTVHFRVNAKNRMGGYTGWHSGMAIINNGTIVYEHINMYY